MGKLVQPPQIATVPLKLALVFLGGGLGSCLRFLVGYWAVHQYAGATRFPVGTFAVNVVGCLAIGVVAAAYAGRLFTDDLSRALVVIGFLGGFTTFSTFGFETFALFRNGNPGLAAGYAVGSMVLGIGAVWIGYSVGR
jgi:CrcB protein